VQVHQTNYLLDIGFSPSVASGLWARVSLLVFPARSCSDTSPIGWARMIWTASCIGFGNCFRTDCAGADSPLMLVYMMVLAQGVLGYG